MERRRIASFDKNASIHYCDGRRVIGSLNNTPTEARLTQSPREMPKSIPYQTRFSKEEIFNIRDFSLQSERGAPLFFAGRESLRQHIQHRLNRLERSADDDVYTEVVQGSPGVGKTSLLRQIKAESDSENIAVVSMHGENLNEALTFVELFLREFPIDMNQAHRFIESRWKTSLETPINLGRGIWSLITEVLAETGPGQLDKFVLLFIDEAQLIRESEGINPILTALHTRQTNALKIMPVFAGLNDTSLNLAKAGVSRIGNALHRLIGLNKEESLSVVNHFLMSPKFGLRRAFERRDQNLIMKALSIASEGWPCHLHCYMQAFAKVLLEDVRDIKPTGAIDLEKVLDLGHRSRISYCQQRLASARLTHEMRDVLSVLAHKHGPKSFDWRDIKECAIELEVDNQERQQSVARAVHSGVLDYDEDNRCYFFPIPSFATFMSESGITDRTLKSMRSIFQREFEQLVRQ